MSRNPSLDILRGVAISLMVPIHFVDNLSQRIESTGRLYDTVSHLGALPAPLFAFVAGLSFSLWARKQQSLGRTERSITLTALKRGVFLFVLGIAFNFCIWLPEETLNWDILTLLGTAYVFLACARNIPLPALGLIAAAMPLLAPPIRTVSDYAEYWENGVFSYDYNARDLISGYLANGYFPLVPWLSFPIVGYVVGENAFVPRPNPKLVRTLLFIGIGSLLITIALWFGGSQLPEPFAKNYASGYSEFPASTEFLFVMLGVCLLAFAFLHSIYDRSTASGEPGLFRRSFTRFSEFSLTLYLLHHALHLWPLWLYGIAMGQSDPTFYWQRAVGTPLAWLLAVVFLVASDLGLRLLNRRRKFSMEWWMRKICG